MVPKHTISDMKSIVDTTFKYIKTHLDDNQIELRLKLPFRVLAGTRYLSDQMMARSLLK